MIVYEYSLMEKVSKGEALRRCNFYGKSKGLIVSMAQKSGRQFVDTCYVLVYDVNDEGVLTKEGLTLEAQAMTTKEFLKLTKGVMLDAKIYNKQHPHCKGYAEVIAAFPSGKDILYYYFNTAGFVLDARDWAVENAEAEPVSLFEGWKRLSQQEQQKILNSCGIRGWAIENHYQSPLEYTYDKYIECIKYTRGNNKSGMWTYYPEYIKRANHTVIIGVYLSFITGEIQTQVTGEHEGEPDQGLDVACQTSILERLQDDEEII